MPQQNVTSPLLFLGCYVKRFSANLGFNTNPTTVEVELVAGSGTSSEDVANAATGFNVTAAQPGNISGLNVGSFKFVGIIQSWFENFGQQGRTYTVRMADPRVVMDNVPVIIGQGVIDPNYTSTPNLLDAFKFYGNPLSLGASYNGTIWENVRSYLASTGTYLNVYGKRFNTLFTSGFLSATGLNSSLGVPPWYKVSQNYLNYNQLLQQVASDNGMDYFIHIVPTGYTASTGTTNNIYVQTIARSSGSANTEINTFITNSINSGILISYKRGQELRTDPVSAVVSGPPRTAWVGANSAGGSPSIMPCWGRGEDGSLLFNSSYGTDASGFGMVLLGNIQGSGLNSILASTGFRLDYTKYTINRTFTPNTYPPTMTIGSSTYTATGYTPTEAVLRASLYSQEAWESMMWKYHQTLASGIGIEEQIFRSPTEFSSLLVTNPSMIRTISLSKTSTIGRGNRDPHVANRIGAIYDATRSAAESFYGKQYVVKMDAYSSVLLSNWLTNNTFISTENYPSIEYRVASSAWSQASMGMPSGASNHELLNASHHASFKDDLNRLKPFVSYSDYDNTNNSNFPYKIDTSLINPNDMFIEQGSKLCLPMNVTQYERYPIYAIVDIPHTIQAAAGTGYPKEQAYAEFLLNMGYTLDTINTYGLLLDTEAVKQFGLAPKRMWNITSAVGNYGVYIPIEFTNMNFGPWAQFGERAGGLNLISDNDLAPWSFGNYTDLETAGGQSAVKAVATSDIIDSAEITNAGLPDYNLGDSLGTNSNITSISLQYGQDGLTTSYSIKTFALPAQRLTKLLFDKITKVWNQTLINQREIVDADKGISRPASESIFKPSQINNGYTQQGKRINPAWVHNYEAFKWLWGNVPLTTNSGVPR